MSILDRSSLEASPLADLHAIASELSIDSFRRLRKAELIDAILARQASPEAAPAVARSAAVAVAREEPAGDKSAVDAPAREQAAPREQLTVAAAGEADVEGAGPSSRRRRGRRGGRGRGGEHTEEAPAREPEAAQTGARAQPEDGLIEGVVELLPGGAGFVRVHPPDPSDEDVYISAAQVRRCELVSGDRVSGLQRPPRRSERFASLVRVDTVNGRPVAELGEAPRFEERPAVFPSELLLGDSDDALIRAVMAGAPIGRGSRVAIVGPAQSGKTVTLRRLASALAARPELELWVVLVGVRPEEIHDWQSGPTPPASALGLAASPDAQSQAVEAVVEQGRRVAARGAHAAVLIDTLDGVHEPVARKAMGSARRLVDGGSLTVIATASHPLGGETTVVALDPAQADAANRPALSAAHSWTMRADLLVGGKQADKLARNRARALHG